MGIITLFNDTTPGGEGGERASRYSEDFRLLKSAKESDFIYLPLQLSHFQYIRNFMPADE